MNLKEQIKTTLSKTTFKLKQHSPELLLAGGIIGIVVSGILACKATIKAKKIVDETKNTIETLDEKEEQATSIKKKTYLTTAGELSKLYLPSIGLGVLSISSIIFSNRIKHKRLGYMTAAYAGAMTGFNAYRKKVVDKYGKNVDDEFKNGVRTEVVKETIVDENGKKKKVSKTIKVVDSLEGYSPYAREFGKEHKFWRNDGYYNAMLLQSEEKYANDLLQLRGFLFLNDVYERLGYPKTKAGQVVGWMYDESKDHNGDNQIDFGIDTVHIGNGDEFRKSVVLDFNVDGPILDLMRIEI